jgi:diguanylate cyclase (GGDEF)-like protein
MLIPAAQEAEALGAANRLAKVLAAQELAVAGHTVRVGVSVGVALYPDHGTSVRELLAAADAAMYHSKEMGRGRVSLYDPLHA